MAKYTIGLDFGTLSGRALLVQVDNGKELAESVYEYPHGVMEKTLPNGTPLGLDWALQHPQDYLDVLEYVVPEVIEQAGVSPEDIISIGVDFTASTPLPIKKDGTPLCFLEEYKNTPHAWVKLWKHHAAQEQANRLNALAHERKEPFIDRYGGLVSSEWQIPKALQILEEAPEIYKAMDYFIEAGDWMVWVLTGVMSKSNCAAGYKGLWHKEDGYPPSDFLKELNPGLEHYAKEKQDYPVYAVGDVVGTITPEISKKTGLSTKTKVVASIIDAHAGFPTAKIQNPNEMMAIIGTSTCHLVLSEEGKSVPGSAGMVEGGIYPGFFAYESGQSAVGDIFAWFVKEAVPESYAVEAKEKDISLHTLLTEKANKLNVGESGLLALDWWNGNRSVLMNADLSGLLVGLTLQTKPEEVYRALIEATAFGTRRIVASYEDAGVPIRAFYASGGISQRNPMLVQIYADVLNLPIRVDASLQGGALGSAIFAAGALTKEEGGHGDIPTAALHMGQLQDEVFEPLKENTQVYDALYKEYVTLHDYFGQEGNNVMMHLKQMRNKALDA